MSNREETEAIISIAQQARPKVRGQRLLRRAQLTSSSSWARTNGCPPSPKEGVGVAESCTEISVTVRAMRSTPLLSHPHGRRGGRVSLFVISQSFYRIIGHNTSIQREGFGACS